MLQTDRQTDGRATAYSEREHEFTFAKNLNSVNHSVCYKVISTEAVMVTDYREHLTILSCVSKKLMLKHAN